MKLVQLKNILYRILVIKAWNQSGLSTFFHSLIWKTSGYKKTILYIQEYDVKKDFTLDPTIPTDALKILSTENRNNKYEADTILNINETIFLEPSRSLGFTKNRRFIVETKSRANKFLYPPLLSLIKATLFKKNIVDLRGKKVWLLDGYTSGNIYHFFHDTLNPFLTARSLKIIDDSFTIVLNAKVAKLKWVQETLKRAGVATEAIYIQQNDYIVTDNLYRGLTGHEGWRVTKKLLGQQATIPQKRNRVFIERKDRHARTISNKAEIYPILAKYNVRIVYLDDLSYQEQIAIFQESELIIGAHGAGLANIIWSHSKKTTLIEIFSCDFIRPDYHWLASLFEIKYKCLVGESLDVRLNFYLNAPSLEECLISSIGG